jgi:hypothetical protein
VSLLGKYRREESEKDDDQRQKTEDAPDRHREEAVTAIPNKERKSPIVSFSIPTDLRDCLRAVRKSKAINLSMWVEKQLREAVSHEFPQIASEYLDA